MWKNTLTIETAQALLMSFLLGFLLFPLDAAAGTQTHLQQDSYEIDSPVDDARVENIWVVDNSQSTAKTIADLKQNIHYYFDDLSNAGVGSKGVLLSSDAQIWDGAPISPQGGSFLISGDEADPVSDFNQRVELGATYDACGNCFNSPIWTLHLFYQQLPGLISSSENYFEPGIPAEILMLTAQLDHYPSFSRTVMPFTQYTPQDWLQSFGQLYSAKKKAFRISALASEANALIDVTGDPSTSASPETYQVMTQATNGTYYATTHSPFNMAEALHDYAAKVIFRAYVHAKNRIPLSLVPADTSAISVQLAGTTLAGCDWTYDATDNVILVDWSKADQGQLQTGDEIQINYPVSTSKPPPRQ